MTAGAVVLTGLGVVVLAGLVVLTAGAVVLTGFGTVELAGFVALAGFGAVFVELACTLVAGFTEFVVFTFTGVGAVTLTGAAPTTIGKDHLKSCDVALS